MNIRLFNKEKDFKTLCKWWADWGLFQHHSSVLPKNGFIVSKNENKDKLIATFGVSDLLIIDSGDVLLICHKNKIQQIKELIAKVNSKNNMKRFL